MFAQLQNGTVLTDEPITFEAAIVRKINEVKQDWMGSGLNLSKTKISVSAMLAEFQNILEQAAEISSKKQ